jgi:hypothetical protein
MEGTIDSWNKSRVGWIYCDLLKYIFWFSHIASQFFICTGETPWLNGKHTVFGKVTNGLDVLRKVEVQGSELGKPKQKIEIVDCGAL